MRNGGLGCPVLKRRAGLLVAGLTETPCRGEPLRHSLLSLLIVILSSFPGILLTSVPLPAQERSGDVLKSLERGAERPREAEKIPRIETEPERKAETPFPSPKIRVKAFRAEGFTILPSEEIKSLVSPWEGKELSLEEIQGVADRITAHYRELGYLLVNAHVPAQTVRDGEILIQVVEGRLDKVTVTGNQRYSSTFIERHLARLRSDPSLREAALERSLLILNEYPYLLVNALLQAGHSPGTTDLVIRAEERPPLSGSLSYDNFGSKSSSRSRAGLMLETGSLLLTGDQLTLRGVTGLDQLDLERLSYGRIDYLVPLDYDGTKVGFYYTNSRYESGEELRALDINGKSDLLGLYVIHPLYRRLTQRLDVKSGFDYKNLTDYILDETWSRDRIRVFSLGFSYDVVDDYRGRTNLAFTAYRGVRDLFDGSGRSDPGVSRKGADGSFSKYTLDVYRIQMLPGNSFLTLRGEGQLSADRLFVVEQFSLGGMGSVRGFDASCCNGDSGYFVSAELQTAPFFPEKRLFGRRIGDMFKLAFFGDHGGVFLNDPEPGESRNDYLSSLGSGLRLSAGNSFAVRLDWAVPRKNDRFNARHAEIYVSAAWTF